MYQSCTCTSSVFVNICAMQLLPACLVYILAIWGGNQTPETEPTLVILLCQASNGCPAGPVQLPQEGPLALNSYPGFFMIQFSQ